MIDWATARRHFLNGMDTKQIADQFGVPEHEIYNGLATKKWMNWRLAGGKLRCGYERTSIGEMRGGEARAGHLQAAEGSRRG